MVDAIPNSIDEIAALDIPKLSILWSEVLGNQPLKRASRDLMVRAIAYRLQEQRHGGLRPSTRRQLDRITQDLAADRVPSPAPAAIKPGTRLLREWHGVIHEVIILETGVQYQGRIWASLSAVAREVTGTRWSGPRFFGLKDHRPR